MGSQFEYTMFSTPKQNSIVESKFLILFNMIHAMLNGGKFSHFMRNGLWADAANTATVWENDVFALSRNMSLF